MKISNFRFWISFFWKEMIYIQRRMIRRISSSVINWILLLTTRRWILIIFFKKRNPKSSSDHPSSNIRQWIFCGFFPNMKICIFEWREKFWLNSSSDHPPLNIRQWIFFGLFPISKSYFFNGEENSESILLLIIRRWIWIIFF